ncbi:MAG: NAD(P)-dependent oxidoreductase, partial [Polyangia bacterium]
ANLVGAGHALTVWNRSRAKADAIAGAIVAATPREAAVGNELVITMLADEHALMQVLDGADGVLAGLEQGALLVDMSTVGRKTALHVADLAHEREARFVDAPVSGSRKPAIEGTLIVLAGGRAADVAFATPALSALGMVRHVGPLGAGASMKLVINGIGAQLFTALSSALGLGEKLGLPREATLDLVMQTPFSSPSFALRRERLLQPDAPNTPDFPIRLLEKDQRLVLEEAQRVGVPMPALAAVRAELQRAIDLGFGDEDMASIIKLYTSDV